MAGIQQWGSPEQYDLTREQLEMVEERAKRRVILKDEYHRQLFNPYRNMKVEGGFPFDPAIQRFASTRADYYHYFKPNKKNFFLFFMVYILPVSSLTYILYKQKNDFDRRCRNAEIPWRFRSKKMM